MKGILFTGLIFLICLAAYHKFIHPRISGESIESKSYGYEADYGYEAEQ